MIGTKFLKFSGRKQRGGAKEGGGGGGTIFDLNLVRGNLAGNYGPKYSLSVGICISIYIIIRYMHHQP